MPLRLNFGLESAGRTNQKRVARFVFNCVAALLGSGMGWHTALGTDGGKNIAFEMQQRIHLGGLALVVALLAQVALASGATAIEDSWNVGVLGRWIGGRGMLVATHESTVVVGVPGGIIILDFSSPDAPVEIASLELARGCSLPNEGCKGLLVVGQHLYVADGYEGLKIIDLSDPARPTLIGGFETVAEVGGVDVAGDYAYVAARWDGLRVIDVSEPAAPVEVGSYDTPGTAYGVAAGAGHAYVADFSKGLRVIDVSNPEMPAEVGALDTNDRSTDVAVLGDHVYLADWDGGLRIIDISDPTNPTEVGVYLQSSEDARSVAVDGMFAYVAYGYRGVRIVDVSDPSNPVEAGYYRDPHVSCTGVAVSGSRVYAANPGSDLWAIEVADPANPMLAGKYHPGDYAYGVGVNGAHAYVADANGGVRVFDVSDPAAPRETGNYPTGFPFRQIGMAKDVALQGAHAYLAIGSWGFAVFDVSDPATPTPVGSLDLFDATAVALDDPYAYVAAGAGVSVVDISNPADPVNVGTYATYGVVTDVALSGDVAYLATVTTGLHTVDVSLPSEPVQLGSLETLDQSLGVAVRGAYAYVADGAAGLRIIDVSDPSNPAQVGIHDTYFAHNVALGDGVACVADDAAGLRIIDISDPVNPVEVGFHEGGRALNVAVNGNHVYVADGSYGFYILEYQQPRVVLNLDIQPGSCPNSFNDHPYTKERENGKPPQGVLPVALLGGADLDVHDVDASSLTLEGVAPLRHGYEDVSTPPTGEDDCACADDDADGYTDLTLKFRRADIVEAMGGRKGSVALTLKGSLHDGTAFEATDCVWVDVKKNDADGPMLMAGTEAGEVPARLRAATPSPFNPVTRIGYSISEDRHVRLAVYNVRGERVAVLVNGWKEAGEHMVTWEAHGLASGVYFYRIESGGHVETRKMVLLK